MSTFVSVGNATQPFSRLLDEVVRLAAVLPQPVVVQHGTTPLQADSCWAVPFIDMNEFERLMGSAELLILHAGAGSVIHAVRAGKVPVVMPRQACHGEIVDDHQLELAHELAKHGKVVLVEEPGQLRAAVADAMLRQKGHAGLVADSAMLRLVADTLDGYARQFG